MVSQLWFQIKTKGQTIYIDPAYLSTYFARYPKRIEFSNWPDPIDGLPEELEKADIILITHDHKDHCKRVTVNRLKRADTLVVAPKRCMKELGNGIDIIEPGDERVCGKTKVQAVYAYNTEKGSSTRKVHRKGHGVSYVITIDSKRIYHFGDTDFVEEMREVGRIDVALLPIGGKFTMDASEAFETALVLKPEVIIPIHHLKTDPQAFKRRVEAKSGIKVVPLGIGEVLTLK